METKTQNLVTTAITLIIAFFGTLFTIWVMNDDFDSEDSETLDQLVEQKIQSETLSDLFYYIQLGNIKIEKTKKNEELIEYKKKKVFSDSVINFSARRAVELKDKAESETDLFAPLKSNNYILNYSLSNYLDDNYIKDTIITIIPNPEDTILMSTPLGDIILTNEDTITILNPDSIFYDKYNNDLIVFDPSKVISHDLSENIVLSKELFVVKEAIIFDLNEIKLIHHDLKEIKDITNDITQKRTNFELKAQNLARKIEITANNIYRPYDSLNRSVLKRKFDVDTIFDSITNYDFIIDTIYRPYSNEEYIDNQKILLFSELSSIMEAVDSSISHINFINSARLLCKDIDTINPQETRTRRIFTDNFDLSPIDSIANKEKIYDLSSLLHVPYEMTDVNSNHNDFKNAVDSTLKHLKALDSSEAYKLQSNVVDKMNSLSLALQKLNSNKFDESFNSQVSLLNKYCSVRDTILINYTYIRKNDYLIHNKIKKLEFDIKSLDEEYDKVSSENKNDVAENYFKNTFKVSYNNSVVTRNLGDGWKKMKLKEGQKVLEKEDLQLCKEKVRSIIELEKLQTLDSDVSNLINFSLLIVYIGVGLILLAFIYLAIIDLKKALKILIGIIVFVTFVIIVYMSSNNISTEELKFYNSNLNVDVKENDLVIAKTAITSTIILIGVAMLSWIGSPIFKLLRK